MNEKYACVVDAQGRYTDFVLQMLTEQADGTQAWAVQHYTLKEGERLVESPRPPTMRPHAGAGGFVCPVWDEGAWVEGAAAEEIAAWEREHPDPGRAPDAIRAARDKLLADTDRYAVLDAPISAESRAALYAYRQALRDVPEQAGFPGNVVWPALPEIVKAAPDPVDAAFDTMTGGNSHA